MAFSVLTIVTALIMPWVLPGLLLVRFARTEKTPHDLALATVVGLAAVAVFGTAARWLGAPAVWPALVICLACAPWVWKQGPSPVARTDLFVMGGLALVYGLPLWGELVPPGGDMSMHTLFARWIDESARFPQTLAPFLPEVRFDAYPVGFHFASVLTLWKVPALTARVVVMTGLSYALFGWSMFFLLRRGGRESAAAVAATLVMLASRNPQSYVGWGGAPTVLSAALALVGARLFWDAWRASTWRIAALAALALAGGILCHPTAGLVMTPVLGLGLVVMIAARGRPRQSLAKSIAALVVAVACVLPYLLFLQTEFSPVERQWVLDEMRQPPQSPRPGLGGAFAYLPHTVGDVVLVLAAVALMVSLARRRWRVLLGPGALALVWVVAYLGTWRAFPLAPMIFPERVAMYAVPCLGWVVACGLAAGGLGDRSWRSRRPPDLVVHGLVVALLLASLTFVQKWYVRGIGSGRVVDAADLECLRWIRANTPDDVLVVTRHGDAGRWVPTLAGRWATRWHVNNVWHEERDRALAGRRPDLFYIGRGGGSPTVFGVPIAGDVLFASGEGDCRCEVRAVSRE